MADRTKDKEEKNGNVAMTAPTPAAPSFAHLKREVPTEGAVVGESYLFRPGDQEEPGYFSNEKDKQGRPVNGTQAGKPHCGQYPIEGWLIQEIPRKSTDAGMKDYWQFEIMLTEPCPALDGEKFRECKAGDVVLLKVAGNLHKLRGLAQDRRWISKVYLKDTGTYQPMKDPNKQPMRVWTKIVKEKKDRNLVNVPRLPTFDKAGASLDEADDFDPNVLEDARPELRA